MAEEGTAIVGEEQGVSLNPNDVEAKARQKGWKGRDESDLPDEDWVDAKEFIGRQKLFDQIHDLRKDLSKQGQQFQKDMQQVSEHFAKMQKVEFDRAMKQLKAEKAIALEDRNIVAVEQINDEIKEKEQEYDAIKQTAPKADRSEALQQELNEWRSKETWFDSDKELQREAVSIGTGYAIQNPNLTQADVLRYVGEKMRQYYPEKFGTRKPKVSDNTVESGGITSNSGLGTKKTKGLSKADLNEQEASVMRTLLKTNALKYKAEKNKVSQEQQYLNDLAEAKGLR